MHGGRAGMPYAWSRNTGSIPLFPDRPKQYGFHSVARNFQISVSTPSTKIFQAPLTSQSGGMRPLGRVVERSPEIMSISKLDKTGPRTPRHESASLSQRDYHGRAVQDVPGQRNRHEVVRVQHMEELQEMPNLRQRQHDSSPASKDAVLLLQVQIPLQRQEGYGHGALPHILPELGDSNLPVCRQPPRDQQYATAPRSWSWPEGRMVHDTETTWVMEASGRD